MPAKGENNAGVILADIVFFQFAIQYGRMNVQLFGSNRLVVIVGAESVHY